MNLPCDLIHPLAHDESCAESLFTYFLSTFQDADFQAISVLGIPEGISQIALVKRATSGPSQSLKPLKYTQPQHEVRLNAFGSGYMQQFAANDKNFQHSITTASSFIYDYDKAPAGSREYHKAFAVGSTLVIPFFSKNHPDWRLRLVVHSSLDARQLTQVLDSNQQPFNRELRHLYLDLMDQFEPRLNPFQAQQASFHPKALKVLKLFSEGDSSKVIASKLHLTEKGVDYHLSVMRERLNARNRTHLVSQAYQQGLL